MKDIPFHNVNERKYHVRITTIFKEISNPFKFIEYVAEKNSPTVIVPEINEVIARLIEKNIIDSNIIITELREGEYATIDL